MAPPDGPSWPDQIFDVLRAHEVRQVAYVPDAGHGKLIDRCIADNEIAAVCLTTEEEGIGLLCGAWLGGQRGVLLMQSSGVGNCINLIGLSRTCRFPLVMLVTMRGEYGEFNPWQVPAGQSTPKVLEAAGVLVHRVERAEEVAPTVDAAARMAFEGQMAVAVLLGQKLIGFKDFRKLSQPGGKS